MKYIARENNSVFNELKPIYQVAVKPNCNNQISVPNDSKAVTCLNRCSRMDRKIVKLAFSLFERVKMEQYEEYEKDLLKDRINQIEHSLENITNKLNTLLKK